MISTKLYWCMVSMHIKIDELLVGTTTDVSNVFESIEVGHNYD